MEDDQSVDIITDRSGCQHVLLKVDGILAPYPTGDTRYGFHVNFGKVSNLHVRDDDIFIIGYQRSGTHWIYEMIGMLLKGNVEPMDKVKEHFMMDTIPIDKLEELPSPRILNCHLWPKHVSHDILRSKNVIYLLRNPKDLAVSSFHFLRCFKSPTHLGIKQYDGKFDDYLEWFLEGKVDFGSWFEYVRAWEDVFESDTEINPIIIHYEDMKKDAKGVLKQVANRLGITCSDNFLEEVATACEINKMRKNNENREDITKQATIDGLSPMYRKGLLGDWKTHFTVASNEKFDAVYKEKMKGSKLQFVYE